MKIGLLSDTHSFFDSRIYKYFEEVDEIWHAGDIGDFEVIQQLENFKPLVAVYGNIDNATIRSEFKEFERFEREGVTVLMTHIAGKPGKYSKKVIEEIKKNGTPQLFVCGHSHILLVKYDPQFKMLWMNPGAFGNHGFHQIKTALRFELNAGRIENLEIIEVDR